VSISLSGNRRLLEKALGKEKGHSEPQCNEGEEPQGLEQIKRFFAASKMAILNSYDVNVRMWSGLI